jgi:hypothetical protein
MINGWKQEPVTRADELSVRGNKAPAVEDAQKVIVGAPSRYFSK